MRSSEFRTKNINDLQKILLDLRKSQLNLRIQRGIGQLVKFSDFKNLRKDIARIKTILNERNHKNNIHRD